MRRPAPAQGLAVAEASVTPPGTSLRGDSVADGSPPRRPDRCRVRRRARRRQVRVRGGGAPGASAELADPVSAEWASGDCGGWGSRVGRAAGRAHGKPTECEVGC